MAKYTVAVCDDEKEDLSFLVRKITEYDTHQLFEIKTYTDGELLFDELKSQKTSIDLLLLDIEMPSNGFQLARTLQALPKHPMVIFVTRQHEYAVQGYGIAFRYLTKPLNDLLFKSAMDAATQELASATSCLHGRMCTTPPTTMNAALSCSSSLRRFVSEKTTKSRSP